jgi:hypothetical protein
MAEALPLVQPQQGDRRKRAEGVEDAVLDGAHDAPDSRASEQPVRKQTEQEHDTAVVEQDGCPACKARQCEASRSARFEPRAGRPERDEPRERDLSENQVVIEVAAAKENGRCKPVEHGARQRRSITVHDRAQDREHQHHRERRHRRGDEQMDQQRRDAELHVEAALPCFREERAVVGPG